MKFFISLGFKHVNGWYLGSVYGPYENDKAVEEEIERLWPNNKTDQFLVFDGQVVNVKPSPKEKPKSEKREPGNIRELREERRWLEVQELRRRHPRRASRTYSLYPWLRWR